MNLSFGTSDFILDPSGARNWPSRGCLIVSDLHLEKGSHFGLRGFFVPPYDSRETLQRLAAVMDRYAPRRLILLGDSFHDPRGYDRLGTEERALFDSLMRTDCLWIEGNHDSGFVPDGVTLYAEWEEAGILFRHQADFDLEEGCFEISGHYHPKATIHHTGARISRPCFVEDGARLILPSFGAYTGGLAVTDPAIGCFLQKRYRCHLLGGERVFSFSSELLG